MVNREQFESDVDYTTVLDNFEGPLDLLLYLINREEIEIHDAHEIKAAFERRPAPDLSWLRKTGRT